MKQRNNGLLKNTIGLMILSILLKGVGFLNRIVIANSFGTTNKTDIYYTASGFIEGLADILLASLTVGIINIYIKSPRDTKNTFLSNVIVSIEVVLTIIAVIVLVFCKPFSQILAPAYTGTMLSELQKSIRVLCIALPFIGITSVFSAALQAEEKFTPVKLTGTIASLVSIVCVVLLAQMVDYHALVLSFIISNIINAIFLRFSLRKHYSFVPNNIIRDKNVKELLYFSIPLILALAAMQVNLMIDKSVATTVQEGAVSALSYSSVLYLFVENIIINSIVVALLPNLVMLKREKKEDELAKSAFNSLTLGLTFLIPLSICMVFYSKDIVRIVYMRGSFTYDSLVLTSSALIGYVIGIPFLLLRDVSIRVFYAYEDTKTPMIINLCSVVINIFMDIVLSKLIGIIGISIATSASIGFSSVIVTVLLKKKNRNYNSFFDLKFFLCCVIGVTAQVSLSFALPKKGLLFVIIDFIVVMIIQMIVLYFMNKEFFRKVITKLKG